MNSKQRVAKGYLITLEGVEGCGKSTQAKRLFEFYSQQGLEVLLTKEPGGTRLGQQVRKILLDSPSQLVCERAELLLFLADRAQHVHEVIRPSLTEGRIVICERYCDSTVAYQHYGLGLPLSLIQTLNDFATDGLMPDLTIVLDIEPQLGFLRKSSAAREKGVTPLAPDRIEQRHLEFHRRVRAGFLEISLRDLKRVRLIDASADEETVFQNIVNLVNEFLFASAPLV